MQAIDYLALAVSVLLGLLVLETYYAVNVRSMERMRRIMTENDLFRHTSIQIAYRKAYGRVFKLLSMAYAVVKLTYWLT